MAASTMMAPTMTTLAEVSAPPTALTGTLAGFDLETTGVDPRTAKVVSAALVFTDGSGEVLPRSRSWLVDPGVQIPEAATRVHGITTETARRDGEPAWSAIGDILRELRLAVADGIPVVVFNAPYDLTLMDAEAARWGWLAPTDDPVWAGGVVVDPLVLDRGLDRYRRGQRTLQAMAAHYGVVATDAHTAFGDALAACRVAQALTAGYPLLGLVGGAQLLDVQRDWHSGWARRYRRWLASRGRLDSRTGMVSTISSDWPITDRAPSLRRRLMVRMSAWRWEARSRRVRRRRERQAPRVQAPPIQESAGQSGSARMPD